MKTKLTSLFSGMALCSMLSSCQSQSTQPQPDPFYLGADLGWCTEMESRGLSLYNFAGEEREATALMQELGLNAVRHRVWVNPEKHGNWCNAEDLLVKCLRAKELGMDIMVDFHYSDWWADPAKQNIPASWEGHDYETMRQDLRQHTIDVLTLLKQNDITPKWVQVGNETTNGLLWSVEMDPVTGWEIKDDNGNTTITQSMGHWELNPEQYAGFIASGYDAVKEIFPEAICIVHLDNGFDADLYNKNFDILRENGAKWDMIGMSLYPYWTIQSHPEYTFDRMLQECIDNIKALSSKYGTDVMIVETGYEVNEDNPRIMQMGRRQLARLITSMREETDNHCKGVFYWEPTCRPNQYKLGAFGSDGKPTAIMRAFTDVTYPDVHDPVMARGEDGRYYIFSTGFGVDVMSSNDLHFWRKESSVFPHDAIPQWAMDSVRGYMGHTWAPDISFHDGQWLLYYSCSTFGKNGSAIGLATNKTLDPSSPDFAWKDQGSVIVSHRHQDNWNAIDPNLIIDEADGTPYLVYGSFWDGIQLIKLNNDFKTPVTEPVTIARRIGQFRALAEIDNIDHYTIEGNDTIQAGDNAIEAPFIIYNDGYYYLFVSQDYCCRGKNSTYRTVYGRSEKITGPFIDTRGLDMAHGGGTLLVGPDDRFYGVGHNSAYCFDGQWYFISHAYDAQFGASAKLYMRPFNFDRNGWINFE